MGSALWSGREEGQIATTREARIRLLSTLTNDKNEQLTNTMYRSASVLFQEDMGAGA
jgi:hypothetical protein